MNEPFGPEFWDERYRSHSAVWSGRPNIQLVSEAADLAAGTALDVGSGEGADAIWLAQRGWHVTATDISAVALERAADHARNVGDDVAARIDWVQVDVTTWEPSRVTFDLVSAQFMHLPTPQRTSLFGRLAASVATGGCLLIVGHHPSDLQTSVPRPPLPDLFYTAADIAASLDPSEWDVIVSGKRERETTDPDGRTVTINDAVLRAQRREIQPLAP